MPRERMSADGADARDRGGHAPPGRRRSTAADARRRGERAQPKLKYNSMSSLSVHQSPNHDSSGKNKLLTTSHTNTPPHFRLHYLNRFLLHLLLHSFPIKCPAFVSKLHDVFRQCHLIPTLSNS